MSIIPRAFLLAALPMILGATDAPAEIITPESMRAHVEFLASDSLEGRETGTRGYDIAAEYDLTLADVYAALAYYFDHRAEIDQAIADSEEFVNTLRQKTPTKLRQKLIEHPVNGTTR